MLKVLVISGPTSTGKTDLAEFFAKKYFGELISADSRQIYKGLDIGTGKDHDSKTKIHLIDLITPEQKFSAYDFAKQAYIKIQEIHSRGHLPIIVGGTGYYLKTLLYPETFTSPNVQSHLLFPFFNILPVKILKFIYKFIDTKNYNNLNHSEQNNPHRLIKRILLKISVLNKNPKHFSPINKSQVAKFKFDLLHLHLTASNSYIFHKIDERIKARLKAGLIKEISTILKNFKFSDPGLNSIAYQEFQPYFKKKLDLQTCIKTWTKHEKEYVKRQKTFFHKLPKLEFNIESPRWQKKVQVTVKKWYNVV